MLWAYFSAGGPGLLILHGIVDSIKYQQIKNQNLTPSTKSYNGPWLDLPSGQNKTNIEINTKICWGAQNAASAPSQSPDLMSGVNWRDEAPTWIWESEGSGESLNGMVSDILSVVLQRIIGENSELIYWQKEIARSI